METAREVAACTFSILAGTASIKAAPQGFMEGHLKILSLKEVELADGNAPPPPKTYAQNYGEFSLIVRSRKEKKKSRGSPRLEWKLSRCAAAGRLCSGRARTSTQGACARNRNRSRLSRIGPSGSIWILTRAFAKLVFIYFRPSLPVATISFARRDWGRSH
jgi:hypothetical protein